MSYLTEDQLHVIAGQHALALASLLSRHPETEHERLRQEVASNERCADCGSSKWINPLNPIVEGHPSFECENCGYEW